MNTIDISARLDQVANEARMALSRAGGGSGAVLTRLSRMWFVDGGSTAPGTPDGNIETPFLTIAAAMTAVAAVADTSTLFVIVLVPKSGGYTENVTVPSNRIVSLTSISESGTINGNVTWPAGAGGGLFLDNVTVTGNVTGTGTGIFLVFEANVNGNIDLSGMTGLSLVELFAATITGNVLFLASTATIVNSCSIGSAANTFTAGNSQIQNSTFNCTAINVGRSRIYTTNFGPNPCTITSVSLTLLDGATYADLLRGGGSAAGTQVIGMADLNRVQAAATAVGPSAAGYAALTAPSATRVASGKFRVRAVVTISDRGGGLVAGDAVSCQLVRDAVLVGPVIVASAVAAAGVAGVAFAAMIGVDFEDNSGKAVGVGTVYTLQVTSSNVHTSGVVDGQGQILVNELP